MNQLFNAQSRNDFTPEHWAQHGSFLSDGTYELTNPCTPRPWQHLLSNDRYLLSLSQLGTGFSTYRGIFANRVTRSYLEQEFDDKRTGRFFYLRDLESGDVFSPMVYPVHQGLEGFSDYSCRYTLGTLAWQVTRNLLAVSLQVLVCPEENTELYLLKLTNLSSQLRSFDSFLYLEWCFSGAPEDQGFALDTGFDVLGNYLWADVRTHPERRFHQTGFITASQPILDYDCRRLAFEGPLGSIHRPAAVTRGQCLNSGGPRIGSTTGEMRTRLTLNAHGSATVLYAVGVAADRGELSQRTRRWSSLRDLGDNGVISAFNEQLNLVEQGCRDLVTRQKLCLDIPGPLQPLAQPVGQGARQAHSNSERGSNDVNLFLDTWLKYQVLMNARWTRWAAKKGYRDVLQDSAGMRLLDPVRARTMSATALSNQRSDGHAPRGWDEAPWGAHSWTDARDLSYWLCYACDAYLRETGDRSLLDEVFPYIDSKESGVPAESGWNHLLKVIMFLWSHRGERGLCLFGESDWNDSLNTAGIGGKGESVWLTQALAHGLLLMDNLANTYGMPQPKPGFMERHAILNRILNDAGWDGNWYRRGYTDAGTPIGSRECSKGGMIYLLPQAWAVLSKTSTPERLAQSRAAVEKHLETDLGPMLYTPSYSGYDPEIGRLSVGGAESDSVYVHAALFQVQADLQSGSNDQAWHTIKRIIPASGCIPPGRSGAEPFCCINAYTGSAWSWPGWSYIGWWSATPSWLLQAVVEWVLGARAEHAGLRIDPHLPAGWEGATITRNFRGATYHITFHKQSIPSTGSRTLLLDGKPFDSNLIPPSPAGTVVRVDCFV